MRLENIYLQPNSPFSKHISDWASKLGVKITEHTFKIGDQLADGLLLINANQDIEKEINIIHSYFDERHLPTRKIDVNGTMQVAISNFDMWFRNFKCKNIFIVGSDDLTKNENLDRFLTKIENKL